MKSPSCSQFLRRSKWIRSMSILVLFVLVYPSCLRASAQQPSNKIQPATGDAGQDAGQLEAKTQEPADKTPGAGAQGLVLPGRSNSTSQDRYRIGLGDVLDIRVFNKPQFSRDSVRVDSHGMIRMPLIKEEIQAACHTEEELAEEIATLYLEYLRNPQVDVFIRDYQSEPVAVLGAVRTPSRFQLQRRVRLLELLSHVGGPTENAGGSIQIVHTAANSMCEVSPPAESGDGEGSVLDNYKLSETMKGDEKANPYARSGDIITVPEAEQAFVVGNVLRPSAIPLRKR